jgi:hypothetical protein
MKRSPWTTLLIAGFLAWCAPRIAFAAGSSDGGLETDGSDEAGAAGMPVTGAGTADDAGTNASASSGGVPLRCDGGLCDTTTGGTPCTFRGRLGTDGRAPMAVALFFAAIAVGRRSRRAKRQAR